MLYDFFLAGVSKFVCYFIGLSIIWFGPFRSGCNFLDIPLCVVKLGVKTNVPIFKSLAGMKRELIWLFIFAFVTIFLLLFGSFHCVFCLCLKSIRYVYRKLISKFVDDESSLHHVRVTVIYNKLNPCWVNNNLVHFYERLQ